MDASAVANVEQAILVVFASAADAQLRVSHMLLLRRIMKGSMSRPPFTCMRCKGCSRPARLDHNSS